MAMTESQNENTNTQDLRQKAQLWEGATEIADELGYPSVTAALEALEKTRLRMAELQGRCGGLEATINEIAEQGESVQSIDIVNLAKGIAKSNLCATPDTKASTGAMVDIEKLRRDLEQSVDSLTSNFKDWEVRLFLELPHQGASEIETVDAYLKRLILPSVGKKEQ